MERAAFTRAVEEYQDMVYRVALHSLGNRADADDAVQEVFLRLFRYGGPFEGDGHLRAWLLRVTVNYCRDVLKSPWRRRRMPLKEETLPGFREPEQEELYTVVMALPEKYRTVLDLFYYEELSVREIGALLRLNTSAVTTRLGRARALLKKQLGEGWQDDE